MALERYRLLGNVRVFKIFKSNTKTMSFELDINFNINSKKMSFWYEILKNKKPETTSFQLQTLYISRSPF